MRVERAQAERRGWDNTTWAMRREEEEKEEGMHTNQVGTMGGAKIGVIGYLFVFLKG